ncbi:MAG: MFS transporter [Chitinophagaceae bacterium]|nr:MFS transporter [Oligoflexus sp.]
MSILKPLRYPSYRCFFLGQITSMAGTTMQAMVQGWLAFQLTHSTTWIGMLLCCQQGVSCLISPYAGRLADKMNRRVLFIAVELGAMIQALLLAACVHWGTITPALLAFLSIILGALIAFELTLRHMMVADMVGPEDLKHGVFLNSITLNLSRVLGPLVGIFMIGGDTLKWTERAFAVNGLSYGLVALLVAISLRWPNQPIEENKVDAPELQSTNVLAFLAYHKEIVALLLASSFLGFFCYPYQTLLPAFADEVLHGGARELSWMVATAGIGAIFSCLSSPSDAFLTNPFQSLAIRILVLAASLYGLSRSHNLLFACFFLFFLGFCLHGSFPLINCAIQKRTSNQFRARIVSLYSMTTLGSLPLGSLFFGHLSDLLGPGVTCTITSSFTVILGICCFPSVQRQLGTSLVYLNKKKSWVAACLAKITFVE